VTGKRSRRSGNRVRFLAGVRVLSSSKFAESCPESYQIGVRTVSTAVKQSGHERNHSPSSLKMNGGIPRLRQQAFMAWCLIEHKELTIFEGPTARFQKIEVLWDVTLC
jgi:hypothetical protein